MSAPITYGKTGAGGDVFGAVPVTLTTPLPVAPTQSPASAGTVASVASTANAGGATLQAANSNRLAWSCFNDSTAILYLILSSTTPTSSVYTVQVAPSGYYEMPYRYTGIIQGIWASANGNARVTELT